MALAGPRPLLCRLGPEKPAPPEPQRLKVPETAEGGGAKIVLQPRVCTLRSYGGDRGGVIRAGGGEDQVSRFFEVLSDYVESSKKSHDFETMSGRLAMVVFAATVGVEIVTGNSVLRKMDLVGIEEAGGVCAAAVASAAVFAWFSSNRNRVGRIFTVGANTFIDSLIDNIIDGLFYDSNFDDWSDEI
ncbi:stress enhanced protein 2, chloroplastic [Salvia miltiorrhiza]|uniref:stress enhanced protein 2, chloroplastic n=1 Tax=Salvia miltiorrhiza TaxID=226208 RepID=UPI0025ACE94B|nr:stress enhanced protein 2, chloroplastic [Salvia miltiorrhiza]